MKGANQDVDQIKGHIQAFKDAHLDLGMETKDVLNLMRDDTTYWMPLFAFLYSNDTPHLDVTDFFLNNGLDFYREPPPPNQNTLTFEPYELRPDFVIYTDEYRGGDTVKTFLDFQQEQVRGIDHTVVDHAISFLYADIQRRGASIPSTVIVHPYTIDLIERQLSKMLILILAFRQPREKYYDVGKKYMDDYDTMWRNNKFSRRMREVLTALPKPSDVSSYAQYDEAFYDLLVRYEWTPKPTPTQNEDGDIVSTQSHGDLFRALGAFCLCLLCISFLFRFLSSYTARRT
jgi:hypothetical protein